MWRDTSLCQSLSHTTTLADAVRYTIKHAELRWQVVVLVSDFDKEKWLVAIGDLLVIDFGKILSNRSHLIIVHELMRHRILVKVYVEHDVGPLGAPVSNDALLREFSTDLLLPTIRVSI